MGKKHEEKIVTKDGAGISVPYTTTSTSNSPQSNYAPNQNSDSPTSVMYWPNINTWHTQGKDAAKKAYYEYLNALNEYEQASSEQPERKLQAASKMNSLIQSMIQGSQIATEAVESINKRIRQGDSTAKYDLDIVIDIIKKMLKTIWIHNYAARGNARVGLEIKPLDSQLASRISRATNLVVDDFGIAIANAEEANLVWLDTTYPPMLPESVEQPAEEKEDPQTIALSPEEQGQADQEQLQQTTQESLPEEETLEENVEGESTGEENEEIPDELLDQYASGEVPEGVEEELPIEEESEEEGVEEEEIPIEEESEEETTYPEEETVEEEEESVEEKPTEEEIEGDDHTQESPEDITTPEEEADEESAEAIDAEEEAVQEEEEADITQDEADKQKEEAAEAEDKLVEESDEANQEISEAERGEEDKTEEDETEEDNEDVIYCIECDRDTTSEDRANCDNEKCPFRTKETEEQPEEETQKHFAIFCQEDHSKCNIQHFVVKEYTGVEGVYCLDCHKLIEYNFNQKEWDSESVRNWIQKQFKQKEKTDKEIVEEVVSEELPEAILKAWIEKVDDIQKKDEEDFEIDENDATNIISNISKVMDNAFSPLNERLKSLGV